MYDKFYNFSEAPFGLSPDPRFLYLPPSHYEAFSAMLSGIRERKGITIITGPPGIGKTTLAYTLLKDLDTKIKSSFVYFTNIDFEQLLRKILLDLGVQSHDRNTYEHMQRFFLYLSERLAQDETVALVIDEAQGLQASVLNDLLRLSTRPQPSSKILQLVLLGQPEFEATLNSRELVDLRDKTSIRRQIRPLNLDESKAYIDHRLKVVGSARDRIFMPEAVTLICEFAGGIPRLINMVCDTALTIGYNDSAKIIDRKIVKRAASDIGHLAPTRNAEQRGAQPAGRVTSSKSSKRLFKPWYAIVAAVIFAVLVFAVFAPWRVQETPSPKESVKAAPGQEEKEPAKELKAPTKVVAEKGSTLSSLVKKQFGLINPTILDLILEANPEIRDADYIEVQQNITIPPISAESFLIKNPSGSYSVHIVTDETRSAARIQRYTSTLNGKNIEIVPRRVSPRKTWHRVQAGPFATREEGLEMVRRLSEKGLMPGLMGQAR
jgi:general secretion pathway protein A